MPLLSMSLVNEPESDLIAGADDCALWAIIHSPQGHINPNASIKVYACDIIMISHFVFPRPEQ